MASRGGNMEVLGAFFARLGELLMALVADEDKRVRHVIAHAVTQARSSDDLEFKTRWHARHDLAANPPGE